MEMCLQRILAVQLESLKHKFLDLDSIHRGNVNLLDSPYLSILAG
jgi:hypothetical protein